MHKSRTPRPSVAQIGRRQNSAARLASLRRSVVAGLGLALGGCWLALAGSARADLLEPWYAGLGIGWSYADTLELDGSDATMDFDRGTNQLTAALGRRVNDAWRVELNYSEFDRFPELLYSSSAGIEVDTDERDSVETSSIMVNVIRDLKVGQAWRPYLGIGVGRGNLDIRYSELEISSRFLQRPRRDILDDEDSGFAWQLIAGVTVPLTRRLELAADFRYWRMPDVNMTEVSGAEIDTDHTVRSAWLQLRYHGGNAGFYQAPAPRKPFQRGWYATGNLGGGFAQDEDIEDTDLVIDAFDLGTTATVGIGYHLHPRWRVELEASYWTNDVEVMEFSKDIGEDSATGDVQSYSLMLNAIHQFNPGSSVRPFIGLGAGWVRSSYDIDTAGFCRNFACDPVEQRASLVDDHGTAPAAQAMVGVEVAITDRLQFSAAYRQLITGSTDMTASDGSPFNTEKRYVTSVIAGFRYGLGR